MRKYWEIAKLSFKVQIAYRFDVCMSMVATAASITFAVVLWGAIFGESETVGGFTLDQMLTYYVLSAFLAMLDMSGGVSSEIGDRVRNGTFSKYMVVPVNTQGYFIAQSAGVTGFYLTFDLAAAVLWTFLFGIRPTLTGDVALIFAALTIIALGLLFMVQFNYALGLLAFRFLDIGPVLIIKGNLIAFLTGALVPLSLLPDWLTAGIRLFPFYHVTYLPAMLLIGKNAGEAALGIVTLSVWLLFITALNTRAYGRAQLRYDGVGI